MAISNAVLAANLTYPDKHSAVIKNRDLLANRPAAGEGEGDLFWATDNNIVYLWDGSSWIALNGQANAYSGAKRFFSTAIQSLPASYTTINWQTGAYTWDTDNYFVTGVRATIPADGYYRVTLEITDLRFTGANYNIPALIRLAIKDDTDTLYAGLSPVYNVSSISSNSPLDTAPTYFSASQTFGLVAGDTIQPEYQGDPADGVRWTPGYFTIERIG